MIAQAFAGVLPGQGGQVGKVLGTNGTAASWGGLSWSIVTSTPTTLAGYGITDAAPSANPTISNPTFTGTAVAPTQAQNDNSTKLANTAFVLGQGSNLTPAMNGSATVGTGTLWARSDHVHPIDTSRAPLASPALSGSPTAPNNSLGTRSTAIATMQSFATEFALSTGAGYQKLSSGLLIQWGTSSIPGNNTATLISFPIAFPTACIGIVATVNGAAFNNAVVGTAFTGNTAFNAFNASSSGTQGIFWISIGY